MKPSQNAKPNNTSLDKYTVTFSKEDQAEFFDVQLEQAA